MGVVDAVELACVLCGCHIQNDWASRSMNVHQILCSSLNIPSQKLFGWFRRPQLWATGDRQLHHKKARAHISCLVQGFLFCFVLFWQNIKSPRWLSPTTAQIWCPVTSGFSPNYNHLWKGRDCRLLMRFRKIQWGSWWQLGELWEVLRCLLWRGLRCHCPVYSVSCIL